MATGCRRPHPQQMTAQLLDLSVRVAPGEAAVARVAAAPVRHVPPAFLAALACSDVTELRGRAQGQALRLAR